MSNYEVATKVDIGSNRRLVRMTLRMKQKIGKAEKP